MLKNNTFDLICTKDKEIVSELCTEVSMLTS